MARSNPTPAALKPAENPDPTLRLQRWGLWLLAFVLLSMPLVYATQTQDQFELPKLLLLRALSSLLLGLLLALALSGRGFAWRRSPLDWPVLAWSLWLVVTTLHSVAPAVSWRGEYENFAGCLTQLNYSALFFLCVQLVDRPEKARLLGRAILASAVGAAVYALMQAAQRDLIAWSAASVVSDRFFGSMGNPNFLGGLMAMAITLKLALAVDEGRKEAPEDGDRFWRWAVLVGWIVAYLVAGKADLLDPTSSRAGASVGSAAVLLFWLLSLVAAPLLGRGPAKRGAFWLAQGADLLLFFQALANTGTRGAFLGLMVGLGALALGWLAVRPSEGPQTKRLGWRLGVGLGLVALLLAGAFAGLGSSFRQRTLASIQDPGHALEVSRLQIWVPALKIWRDHPIAGSGLDSFKTVFPAYSKSRFAKYDGENVSSRMAHCEPLQVLATEGAVGLALWLLLCGAAFLAWWRGLRALQEPAHQALLIGVGALVAAYLAQNLVSFGVVGISVPFWVCLGLLFSAANLHRSALPLPKLGLPAALAAGSLLALGGLWLDARTLRADLDYAFANQLQGELDGLDNANLEDLREAAGFAFSELSDPGLRLTEDLRAEAELWRQGLGSAESQLASNPSLASQVRPYYVRGAGAALMVLALARLQEAVELCPEEVKYKVYQGLCSEDLFRRCDPERRKIWFQAADAAYTRGVELNPGNSYYRGNEGRLWGLGAEGGNEAFFEKAQEHYLKAVALAPVTRLFYENLLLLQARFARIQDADALLAKASAADQELAPKLFMEAASTFFQWRGSGAPAWTPQAKAAALQAAVEWTTRAQALDPQEPNYALSLAVFDLESKDRAGAKRWAQRALELNPGLAAARQFLAENHLNR